MSACWPVGIGIIQLRLRGTALRTDPKRGSPMRATILAAVLTFAALSLVTPGTASSLPGLSERPSAASSGLVEQARTQHYRNARKHRYRRPYYVPYASSRPYQYRYWQYYAPICYPL